MYKLQAAALFGDPLPTAPILARLRACVQFVPQTLALQVPAFLNGVVALQAQGMDAGGSSARDAGDVDANLKRKNCSRRGEHAGQLQEGGDCAGRCNRYQRALFSRRSRQGPRVDARSFSGVGRGLQPDRDQMPAEQDTKHGHLLGPRWRAGLWAAAVSGHRDAQRDRAKLVRV